MSPPKLSCSRPRSAQGGSLIEVNLYETSLTYMCDVVLRGPSGESLPLLVQRVKEKREGEAYSAVADAGDQLAGGSHEPARQA